MVETLETRKQIRSEINYFLDMLMDLTRKYLDDEFDQYKPEKLTIIKYASRMIQDILDGDLVDAKEKAETIFDIVNDILRRNKDVLHT